MDEVQLTSRIDHRLYIIGYCSAVLRYLVGESHFEVSPPGQGIYGAESGLTYRQVLSSPSILDRARPNRSAMVLVGPSNATGWKTVPESMQGIYKPS